MVFRDGARTAALQPRVGGAMPASTTSCLTGVGVDSGVQLLGVGEEDKNQGGDAQCLVEAP